MATEHESWVDWARQSAEAEIRDLRVEWRAIFARAETAEAALAALQTPCVWREQEDGSYWDTGCGEANCFEVDGPLDNGYRFCPYCRHPIEVAKVEVSAE